MKKAGDECGAYIGRHEAPCEPGEIALVSHWCDGKIHELVRCGEEGGEVDVYYMQWKGCSPMPDYGSLLACDKCSTVVFSVDLKGGS